MNNPTTTVIKSYMLPKIVYGLFIVAICMYVIIGLATGSLLEALPHWYTPPMWLVGGFFAVVIYFVLNFYVRRLVIKDGVLHEEIGWHPKKRNVVVLGEVTAINAVSKYGLELTMPEGKAVLNLLFYRFDQLYLLLLALQPLLEKENVKKGGKLQAVLTHYFAEYRPVYDPQANRVSFQKEDVAIREKRLRRHGMGRWLQFVIPSFLIAGLLVVGLVSEGAEVRLCKTLNMTNSHVTARASDVSLRQYYRGRTQIVQTIDNVDVIYMTATYTIKGRNYSEHVDVSHYDNHAILRDVYKELADGSIDMLYNPDNPKELYPAVACKALAS